MKKIAIILVTLLFFGLRFVDFDNKMTFHLDQGLHLLEVREMVDSRKIRLVGPMVTSKTFLDRGFFIGPQYYYVLAVIGIVENWDPLLITKTMTIIEFIVFFVFCYWVSIKWNTWTGIIIGFVLSISPYLIIHSRFFWNPHMLLWVTMLAPIIIDRWIERKKSLYLFLLGLMWGIAFGFHYSAIFWILPIGYILLKNIKSISWNWISLPIGFLMGDLPYIIFELRHNFYNIKTFYWVMSQSSNGNVIEPHYIINPLLSFTLLGTLTLIYKVRNIQLRIFLAAILIVITYLIQRNIYTGYKIPLGHPIGWNYNTELLVVDKILKDGCPKDFNIASTVSGDTRSYDLRYLLSIKKCPPMGVDEYPKAKKLFLVAPPSRPPENETVWEVSSLGKFNIKQTILFNDKVILYELEKI